MTSGSIGLAVVNPKCGRSPIEELRPLNGGTASKNPAFQKAAAMRHGLLSGLRLAPVERASQLPGVRPSQPADVRFLVRHGRVRAEP